MHALQLRPSPLPLPPPLPDVSIPTFFVPWKLEWPEWRQVYGGGFKSRLKFLVAGGWEGFGATISDEEACVRGQHYRCVRKRECHIFRDELFCFHDSVTIHPEFR